MNWYIGQKIVAIVTHSLGDFKEGQVFEIKTLRQGCCSIWIDIGIPSKHGPTICYCGKIHNKQSFAWYCETAFAPLDEMQAHESAIKQLFK